MPRWLIDPDRSEVHIDGSSSLHPISARARGLTGWVELDLDDGSPAEDTTVTGALRIDVERLRSGNPLVDRETRRRIDAHRHPEIVGTATRGARSGPDTLAVVGTIDFRGVEREVEGELRVSAEGDGLLIEGSATFDVRDWGLRVPRLGLLRVHHDVVVTVHLAAVPA